MKPRALYPIDFFSGTTKKGITTKLKKTIYIAVEVDTEERNWCWITPIGGEGKVRVLRKKVIVK